MCLGCRWGHGETKVAPSGMPGTALSLLTSGHSGLGVSLHSSPAVGPRPCLYDPVRRCVIRSWLSSMRLFIHFLFPSLSRHGMLHSVSQWPCFCSLTRSYCASARYGLRLSQKWLPGFGAFLQCCFCGILGHLCDTVSCTRTFVPVLILWRYRPSLAVCRCQARTPPPQQKKIKKG